MSIDVIFTGVIVAVAAGWAGRRLWRSVRSRSVSSGGGCADQPGGCAGCGMASSGTPSLGSSTADPGVTKTAGPCEERPTDES